MLVTSVRIKLPHQTRKGSLIMDQLNSNTAITERKRGQHLGPIERGAIEHLHRMGYSNRAIAKELNCSPATVGNELRRGTSPYCGHGRKPIYSAKRAQKVYEANRENCHRKRMEYSGSNFFSWLTAMVSISNWSLDTCLGRAKKLGIFTDEALPSCKTLYNMLWQNRLQITPFQCPETLSRKHRREPRNAKRLHGQSIDLRPEYVLSRNIFGHWEADTVVGKKRKGEAAAFTIVERLTGYYISIKIDGKTTKGVKDAMTQLKQEFGEKFSEVFKTITTDNGSEFADFSELDLGDTKVYFAHPYSSWERPVNERSNRLLRRYIPKGVSMNEFSADEVREFSDEINALPRKRLGYATPEELFEDELDRIYQQAA